MASSYFQPRVEALEERIAFCIDTGGYWALPVVPEELDQARLLPPIADVGVDDEMVIDDGEFIDWEEYDAGEGECVDEGWDTETDPELADGSEVKDIYTDPIVVCTFMRDGPILFRAELAAQTESETTSANLSIAPPTLEAEFRVAFVASSATWADPALPDDAGSYELEEAAVEVVQFEEDFGVEISSGDELVDVATFADHESLDLSAGWEDGAL
jgi:hypothetical protein